ncbi:MAG: hypothetical protein HOV80_04680 [Polyangiaceae bacterium]|nr:hypothetical protein [Polyangiaceae bacterium]
MSLSEVEFAFFFPLFLILYWILPRKAAWQNAALVAGSLFFYATWSLKLLPLFLLSTAIDYAVLRGFARFPVPADDAAEDAKKKIASRRKLLLTIGLVSNLGALIWF